MQYYTVYHIRYWTTMLNKAFILEMMPSVEEGHGGPNNSFDSLLVSFCSYLSSFSRFEKQNNIQCCSHLHENSKSHSFYMAGQKQVTLSSGVEGNNIEYCLAFQNRNKRFELNGTRQCITILIQAKMTFFQWMPQVLHSKEKIYIYSVELNTGIQGLTSLNRAQIQKALPWLFLC